MNNGFVNSNRRLFIFDTTNKLKFLIDTGADLSIVPRDIYNDTDKKNEDLILTAANGSKIHTYGRKMLKVNLGLRRDYPFVFTIADINSPIIGADFLTHYGIIVDLKNKRLIDSLTNLTKECFFLDSCSPSPKIFYIENNYAQLLQNYPNLVIPPNFSLPVKHSVKHNIITNGYLPFCRPRRLDPTKFQIAKEEFRLCGVYNHN